ncbi:hypothetical protein BN1221_01383c [Brenneria goodwinii]|uniref:Uncharacterized protein n=1 Tax=Brenneria goodwinii TaxID=1109412 RepID=A0A0G4JSQ1_9GAMM|nr:hypothetical protein BN1221_01383c [Brenneria goodwinii]
MRFSAGGPLSLAIVLTLSIFNRIVLRLKSLLLQHVCCDLLYPVMFNESWKN